MKQTLLATTALAAISMANTVNAAEWDVRVGGYFEQILAFSSANSPAGSDFDGVDVSTDAEIHFKPSITLDNGLKIGVNIQLEAFDAAGDTIDESFVSIKGSFGEVLIGSENSAGYKMTYAAPDVTFLNINSGSTTTFIPFSGTVAGISTGDDVFRRTLGTTYLENVGNNDASRFTYFTPRFSGFQIGVSYARDPGEVNGPVNNNAVLNDIFDIGANYVNSFGDFNVAISGRWGIASDPISGMNPEVFGAGINLGFGGVTIGGSFAEQNNSFSSDGQSYDAGISYETGPWGFSFTYFHGKNTDNEHIPFGFNEELDQYLIGMNYKLAKGVDIGAFGAYIDFKEERDDAGAATGADDVSGFIIGTGIKFTF
jgi:predicted porin